MKELCLDIETYSGSDIQSSGVYRYAEDPDFEILCMSYSVDQGEVKTLSLASGERMPDYIAAAIKSPFVKKYAHNASFERVCLSRYFGLPTGQYLNPDSWYCDMVLGATLSLPLALKKVGLVLGIEKQKLDTGEALINYFSKPCKPTKANGMRTRNRYYHDPEKWKMFLEYNKRDVEAELEIHRRISVFPPLPFEWKLYHMDQRINDYGVHLDMPLVYKAIECDKKNADDNMQRAKDISGLENPNSVSQLKEWFADQGLEGVESLAKADVQKLLENAKGNVKELLELRQELSKTSVKKYTTMVNVVGNDERARGLIQFYGATHTGRFSGRLIQVQNLVANHMEDLEEARTLIREGEFETAHKKWGNLSNVLSELIRTAFIPTDGNKFIVCDYAQIEARVLAWYAGETWRLNLFKEKKDLYCMSASKMFGVPVEKNGLNGDKRKTGKVAELACGYQGGVGAMKRFGAVAMGIPEEELGRIVASWRDANPHIVAFWYDIERLAKEAVLKREEQYGYGLEFSMERGILFIRLPSGRRLAYCKPQIGLNRFGNEAMTYEGVGTSKNWTRLETYGGKLVENIVQATARDILCEAMYKLTKKGLHIVMHVHDEVIIDCGKDESNLEEVRRIMTENPSWCKDLPLDAAGYECSYYYKD